MEGATGIEPALPVWKTGTLPLSYAPAAAEAAASDSLYGFSATLWTWAVGVGTAPVG